MSICAPFSTLLLRIDLRELDSCTKYSAANLSRELIVSREPAVKKDDVEFDGAARFVL